MNNAPWHSSIAKKRKSNGTFIKKIPFAGEGFYFWEDNIEHAHHWGQQHYDNKYSIVEFEELKVSSDLLLDFLNPNHRRYFKEMKAIWLKKEPKTANYAFGQWIEFFKRLDKKDNGIFPFKFIRAKEELGNVPLRYKVEKMAFSSSSSINIDLNPCVFLCILDKTLIKYGNRKIIFNNHK
ncbi:MAG: hypothetical protein WBG46_11140 [Nonlabens sp.]